MSKEETTVMRKGALVKRCTCDHGFQDRMYGKGNRVFTPDKDDKPGKCTVCGVAYRPI